MRPVHQLPPFQPVQPAQVSAGIAQAGSSQSVRPLGQPSLAYVEQPTLGYGGKPTLDDGGQPTLGYGGQPTLAYGGQPTSANGGQPTSANGGQPTLPLVEQHQPKTAADASHPIYLTENGETAGVDTAHRAKEDVLAEEKMEL